MFHFLSRDGCDDGVYILHFVHSYPHVILYEVCQSISGLSLSIPHHTTRPDCLFTLSNYHVDCFRVDIQAQDVEIGQFFHGPSSPLSVAGNVEVGFPETLRSCDRSFVLFIDDFPGLDSLNVF